MYYQFYEWNHAFLSPARALNDAVRLYYRNPLNPLTHTGFGRQIAAAGDLFERMTRHYGKPEFGIEETVVDGRRVAVSEEVVWQRPFCKLIRFARDLPADAPRQPNVVLVAPMSGHYATLLRGTVEALLPHNNVYITDWVDARKVPLAVGRFDLDDFVDYMIDIIYHFHGDAHLVAVCQPAVPVFAATAIMERRQSAFLPKSITLMGGPIDTRQNPTEVNTYAEGRTLEWFRRNVIMPVPFPHPGVMRKVYPGFLQLTGFMTMNLDRHLTAHYDYFDHLVKGDGDSADKHREFYDEYLSVMDLTAEFYLQTVDTVFLRHALPKGEMTHRDALVDPAAITRTPILTIEGEKDDISGIGQTRAAHTLAVNLPDERKRHYEQSGVGHYGVFNGSRFRNEIAPRICAFVSEWDNGPHDLANVAETAARALAASEAAARDIAVAADTLEDIDAAATPTAAPANENALAEDTAAVVEPIAADVADVARSEETPEHAPPAEAAAPAADESPAPTDRSEPAAAAPTPAASAEDAPTAATPAPTDTVEPVAIPPSETPAATAEAAAKPEPEVAATKDAAGADTAAPTDPAASETPQTPADPSAEEPADKPKLGQLAAQPLAKAAVGAKVTPSDAPDAAKTPKPRSTRSRQTAARATTTRPRTTRRKPAETPATPATGDAAPAKTPARKTAKAATGAAPAKSSATAPKATSKPATTATTATGSRAKPSAAKPPKPVEAKSPTSTVKKTTPRRSRTTRTTPPSKPDLN